MARQRDYYEILSVSRDATGAEIKSAYRQLAVRYHPDRNPGDAEAEERFKEAAEAYAVLSDADKRSRFDRFGHAGLGGAAGGAAGFDPAIFADFSDILGDFFGFGGGRRRGGGGRAPRRGADLRYDLVISFEEAAFGSEETLRIPRLETCPDCKGGGSADGKQPRVCSACGGHGQVRYSQGFFTVARTCPQCHGEGTVVADPCRNCRGEGRVERERSIQVTIPAGVDSGSRLRLTGEGEHGRFGGPAGDLYVVIAVEPHDASSGTAPTSSAGWWSATRRRCWGRRWWWRRCTARRRWTCRRVPRTGGSSGCAARGSSGWTAAGGVTTWCASRWRCRIRAISRRRSWRCCGRWRSCGSSRCGRMGCWTG